MKRVGKVKITYELLEAALQLSKGNKITRTHDCSLFESDEALWVRITGPDMPEVQEGMEIPLVDLPRQEYDYEEINLLKKRPRKIKVNFDLPTEEDINNLFKAINDTVNLGFSNEEVKTIKSIKQIYKNKETNKNLLNI